MLTAVPSSPLMKGQRMVAASGTGSVSAPAAASWTPAPTAKVAAAYTGQPAQQGSELVLPTDAGSRAADCEKWREQRDPAG